jgi:ElaB/YqjD/DUF883 family membrane-anchored ribosome-binding protein
MKQRILEHAEETDRFVRRNPYSFLVVAGLLGMVAGARLSIRKRKRLADAIS